MQVFPYVFADITHDRVFLQECCVLILDVDLKRQLRQMCFYRNVVGNVSVKPSSLYLWGLLYIVRFTYNTVTISS